MFLSRLYRESEITQATLNAPTISLSGSTLTLTNPSTNGNFAQGFNIYNGTTLLSTQLIDVTTLDLSTVLTEEGTYTITAKCYGTNMAESSASSSVSYVVEPESASVGNCIVFSSSSSFSISMSDDANTLGNNGTLEYSQNGTTWASWTGQSVSSGNDNSLYFRGSNNTTVNAVYEYYDDDSESLVSNYVAFFKILGTNVSCSGNIENLLDYTKVANGEHPTMAEHCYDSMFYNCTSLTTPPSLPATTLADSCYAHMFYNCTSLTTVPKLPATTLADSCYQDMFAGCTSLATTPSLPATTLASSCYDSMFYNCTSLTTPPELPATTLTYGCYYDMFSGCTSLTISPELPATTLADYCYDSMFEGCTSLTTTPTLPATTLVDFCYYRMFKNCTSLITLPELPATTLVYNCYEFMFNSCTSLKISSTQTGEYQYAWRIPTSGTGNLDNAGNYWNYEMLKNTGGTFTFDPSINTTYYTTNQPV